MALLNVDIILFPHLYFEIFLAEKFIKEALSNIVTHNLDMLAQSLSVWSIVEDMYLIFVFRVQSVLLIELLFINEFPKP